MMPATNQISPCRAAMAMLLACALVVLLPPEEANATIASILCSVWWLIYNDIGRGIGTLAIAGLAVGAVFGKVSWGMAVMVSVGLIITFSAGVIAWKITGANPCNVTGY